MKELLNSFHLNGRTLGFSHSLRSENYLVQHNKQYGIQGLFSDIHLNSHMLESFVDTTLKTTLYSTLSGI